MKNHPKTFGATNPLPTEGEDRERTQQATAAFTPIGFTLAELLIALAILGVIATFTIPKILDSGSDSKFNAITKEAISMVAGAYQAYKLNNPASASTNMLDLTPYMNYVKDDTTSLMDDVYSIANIPTCGDLARACLLLHNGALFRYNNSGGGSFFGDTSTTSALFFRIDPDGKVTTDGSATSPGKTVEIWMYFNGRMTSRGNIEPNTYCGTQGPTAPGPQYDPPWFSWSN